MTAGARLADIARASGDVAGFTVEDASELTAALDDAMDEIRKGRPAVVDVRITRFSSQVLSRG
jgi:thiamine pyrophosphate-dependent acetolactate synthase large subunit-like protein